MPATTGRGSRGRGGADAPLLVDRASTAIRAFSARRFGSARARRTVVGVLEPSVPYPAETELIANVVTSPHHLSATMVTGREHRMTEVFGRLAQGASLDVARGELVSVHDAIKREYAEAYPAPRWIRHARGAAARSADLERASRARGPVCRLAAHFRHRLLERCESASWRAPSGASLSWRFARRSGPTPAASPRRCSPRVSCCVAPAPSSASCSPHRCWRPVAVCVAVFVARPRGDGRRQPVVGRRAAGDPGRRAPRVRSQGSRRPAASAGCGSPPAAFASPAARAAV